MDTHRNIFRCQPVHGRCRYPDEFIQHTHCRYHVPLPRDIQQPPSHTGHGHQAHNGGHTQVLVNRSGSHHISGERVRRIGGHHGHSDEEILYDDSYFGNSGGRIDDNDPAFSDDEDVFARSMSQVSNHGFVSGYRRGGTGHSERVSRGENGIGVATSRNGAVVRSGRSSRGPSARGETPRDPPLKFSTSHDGASRAETASRRGAASHGGQGPRDRMLEGQAPRETSNAATPRRGTRRSAASHSDRGPRDRMVQGEAPHDPPSNPGARIIRVAPAGTASRTNTAAHGLREPPIGTAEVAAPANTTSLITATAHQVEEPRNSTAQDATVANPSARRTVAAPTNTISRTDAAAHEIQQRLHSMDLGAATAGASSRTAAVTHSVQSPFNNSAQSAVARIPGGEDFQGGLSGHQASRNGVPKSVRFQTATRKAGAEVSEDY